MNKQIFKKDIFRKLLTVASVVAVVAVMFLHATPARSSATQNFAGWGWGADDNTGFGGGAGGPDLMDPPGGLGWLSFNCTTGGGCAVSDYGVDIDQTTGEMTGYAWSSNYGWLKFGGLSGFPNGNGNIAANAKIDPVTLQANGWARFCAAASNPATCSGTSSNLDNGGWDGWVSLRGTGPDYGISLTTADGTLDTPGTLSGYAWGGSDSGRNIVGWVDFAGVNYLIGPSVSIKANPQNAQAGQSITISWIGENLINSPTGCQTSGSSNTGPDWYGVSGGGTNKPSPIGAFTTAPLSAGVYTYSIQCLGADGISLSNTASVQVVVGGVAILNFYADPGTVYPPDFSTTLKWQVLNSNSPLTNCVANSSPPLNPVAVPNWSGGVADAPLAPAYSSTVVPVDFNPTNFKLTCEDSLGNPIVAQVSALRGSLLESLTLKATAVRLDQPSGNFLSDLSWSAINMEIGSCVGLNGGPNWPGVKIGPPGEQQNVIVPPTAPDFTTYSLKCIGKYSGDAYIAEIQLNEGSGGTFSTARPKYVEN